MRTTALLIAVLLGFTTSAIAAPPPKTKSVSLGKHARLNLEHGTTAFTIAFDKKGTVSRTVGDPQVFWNGKWFYWPAREVVYVLPNGVRLLGTADTTTGFCSSLIIIKGDRVLKVINWKWVEDGDWLAKITSKIVNESHYFTHKGKRMTSAAYYLRWFRKAPRIVWKGASKGWQVFVKGKRKNIVWRDRLEPKQSSPLPGPHGGR